MGESAQKRRLVGEREELEEEPADDAPPPFRHLGYARQKRAACLMFCFKELLRGAQDSAGRVTLASLPPELIELIVRHCVVLGSAVVRFTHPEALECVATLRGHDSQIRVLESFKPANGVKQLLASGDEDGSVKLRDLSTRECVATLVGHTEWVKCLSSFVDANGVTWLASGSADHTIILWDVVAHTQVARLSDHTAMVTDLAVFRNAAVPCLASASLDKSIKLWDLRSHTAIATLSHTGFVVSLCVFSDAHGTDFLVSGGVDKSIKVWDLASHKNVFTLRGHTGLISSLARFSNQDGVPMLVSASHDKTVMVWDLESRVAVKTLDCGPLPTSLVCVAGPDGHVMLAYTSGAPRTGTIIDLSTGRPVFPVPRLADSFAFDAFVDRASGVPFLAVAGREGKVAVIQLYTDPGGV
jgi:WD40 repeat protein